MKTTSYSLQRFLFATAALAFVLGGANGALALDWFDDWNDGSYDDGNPQTWTPLTLLPGEYDASSGDFVLTGVDDFSNDETLIATVEGIDFGDTSVRTRAVVDDRTLDPDNEVAGNVGVIARYDPATISGYLAVLDDGDHLSVIRADGGVPSWEILIDPDTTYTASSDIMIQMEVTGTGASTLVEVTLWDPADPMPDTPQFSGFDESGIGGLETGVAGIIYNEDDDASSGIYRFAQASSEKIVDAMFDPADFDMDGDVDGDDFLTWQAAFNVNADGDTDNDGDDFLNWQAAFGSGTGNGSGAVPEPTTAALALLAALFCAAMSMRKRLG